MPTPRAVFVVWSDAVLDDVPAGPWTSWRTVADGVAFVESDASLSVVYHEIKWSLPAGAALLVTLADGAPKFRGLRPGALSWLRGRR